MKQEVKLILLAKTSFQEHPVQGINQSETNELKKQKYDYDYFQIENVLYTRKDNMASTFRKIIMICYFPKFKSG